MKSRNLLAVFSLVCIASVGFVIFINPHKSDAVATPPQIIDRVVRVEVPMPPRILNEIPYPSDQSAYSFYIHSRICDRFETPLPVYQYLIEDLKTGIHYRLNTDEPNWPTGRVMKTSITTESNDTETRSYAIEDYTHSIITLANHRRRFMPLPDSTN